MRIELKKTHKKPSIYGPVTWFRARKDGTCFYREEKTTLWDYNGVMLKSRKLGYKFTFVWKREYKL